MVRIQRQARTMFKCDQLCTLIEQFFRASFAVIHGTCSPSDMRSVRVKSLPGVNSGNQILVNSCNKRGRQLPDLSQTRFKSNAFHIFIFLLIILTSFSSVQSSGLFELDIIKYENYHFNESLAYFNHQSSFSLWHQLTNWSLSHSNQLNHLNSNLIYNLCLKESKARVLGKPCTFGETQISASLPNQPVSLKQSFTFRWTKSITLILTIMKMDERTSELKQIDKHVHFDSNLLPVVTSSSPNNRSNSWTYKLSIHSFSRLLYRFRITCSTHYYGEDCSRFCRERDDLFGHYSCNREGSQICMPGWQGEQCDYVTRSVSGRCLSRRCLNGGECVSSSTNNNHTNFKCNCPPKWTGERCESEVNECITQPNLCGAHGQCVDDDDGYKCRCERGFEGAKCDKNIDECAQSIDDQGCVMSNTARCVDTYGSFECQCLPGWTGKYCHHNVDDCLTNRCINGGQCIDLVNDYKCLCPKGFKGKYCGQFDESVCEYVSGDDETIFVSEYDIDPNSQQSTASSQPGDHYRLIDARNQYWQIQTAEQLNSKDCKSKWCTCSNDLQQTNSTTVESADGRHLKCVCVREDEYEELNRKQLEKLSLALNPTVDQLMLVSDDDVEQQNYLLEQLPIKLRKQIKRPEQTTELSTVSSKEAHSVPSNGQLISESLIDDHLDSGDDLFVSLTLRFNTLLANNQTQSICSSMLAIYSLICNQPILEQLNFACKTSQIHQSNVTTIRFYTLDNDERLLNVAQIIAKSLENNFNLQSIVKRTHLLTAQHQFTRWQLHWLLVVNVCFLFWLFVVVVMIYIILSTDDQKIRSQLGENRWLSMIALQLNRRIYRKNEAEMQLNKVNHYVICNDLNTHSTFKSRTNNSTLNNVIYRSTTNDQLVNQQNKFNNFKQLGSKSLFDQQIDHKGGGCKSETISDHQNYKLIDTNHHSFRPNDSNEKTIDKLLIGDRITSATIIVSNDSNDFQKLISQKKPIQPVHL